MLDNDDLVRLSGNGSHAVISSYGAQVLQWQPAGDEPVLWLSPAAVLNHDSNDTPARGGIPVCLPWFGIHHNDPHAPMHGFARTTRWTIDTPATAEGAASSPSDLSLSLTHQPGSPTWGADGNHYPHSFTASLHINAAEELLIKLTVTNNEDYAITFEEALHTYFSVGDIKDIVIEGLNGAPYQDMNRDPNEVYIQHGELTPIGPLNRIYESNSSLSIKDPRSRRMINISTQGTASTIVWTPWKHQIKEIKDAPPEDWERFVCIESGNVRTRALTLEKGESHTLSVVISSDAME